VTRLKQSFYLSSQDRQLVLKLVLYLVYGIIIFVSIANLLDGLTSTWKFMSKDVLPIYRSLMNAVP
jgi:hypothetical protein